ncbi:MAG: hypothetical protein QNI97_08255 [Desulfobacterales bacterium]|nr:hypothetical protein [Desulfobacterales bacterium]
MSKVGMWKLQGAIIEFSQRFLGPIPNIIIFQYNPATFSRTLTPYTPISTEGAGEGSEPGTAAPFDPEEKFSLTLELDATDALEFPESHPVAFVSGVADRIAALEMLVYPDAGDSLLGELAGAIGDAFGGGDSGSGGADPVPRTNAPITMLFWGPGRIAPVRLTEFKVEEQAFNSLLYAHRAEVTVGFQILTPDQLDGYPDGLAKDFAKSAYEFTKTQKEVLAMANLANSVESILGMLPF